MPLVRQPTLVSLTFRDRARKSSSSFFVGEAAGAPPDPIQLGNPNVAAPFAFLQELYDNMKDVSDCAGVGYSITYSWVEDPVLLTYGPSPNVERKGVWQFKAGAGNSIFTVPGIKDAAQAANGKQLRYDFNAGGDPVFSGSLSGDLQSIHDKLRNGATIGPNTFPVVNYQGIDFGPMLDAYQQTRSSSGKG